MDWISILSAVALAAMIVYLFPRAKQMAENSPKGSSKDWMGFIVPVLVIVVFIILLIQLV